LAVTIQTANNVCVYGNRVRNTELRDRDNMGGGMNDDLVRSP